MLYKIVKGPKHNGAVLLCGRIYDLADRQQIFLYQNKRRKFYSFKRQVKFWVLQTLQMQKKICSF